MLYAARTYEKRQKIMAFTLCLRCGIEASRTAPARNLWPPSFLITAGVLFLFALGLEKPFFSRRLFQVSANLLSLHRGNDILALKNGA